MEYALDASAILTGRQFAGELVSTPRITGEVRRKGLTSAEESFLERVRVFAPSPEAAVRVAAVARSTGDDARLSPADAELLALALERGCVLVTDDYSIQNVATVLGVRYEPVLELGIREVRRWHRRCTGCGRYFDEPVAECPVCGSAVKTTRRPPP
ncbi:MAG TPA: PIN domain-containing protein [Thermoplasmata archaeon]|nr:PIN domain-containing protein [Thermoplasmata archaeon]